MSDTEDIIDEVQDSYLTSICKNIRALLESKTYMINKCKDSLKSADDPFIKTEALEPKHLVRDYTCSVYHTCKEVSIEAKNWIIEINGLIYIDLHRKINPKTVINLDELDKFAHTVLQILYTDPNFNGSCEAWEFSQKQLWKVNPDSKGSDKMPENKLLDYICQITIICKYTYNFSLD